MYLKIKEYTSYYGKHKDACLKSFWEEEEMLWIFLNGDNRLPGSWYISKN